MTAPTLYYTAFPSTPRRRVHIGLWRWKITDGIGGRVLASGTALTEWGARVRQGRAYLRCVKRPEPAITDDLVQAVLDRFAVELREAGPLQLEHLAERAEGRYASALGERMRELVDVERTIRRAVAHG